MTKREIATLVLKIAALALFARYVGGLTSIPSTITRQPDFAIGISLPILVAILVWIYAESIATRLFPSTDSPLMEQVPRIAEIGVALTGLWVIVARALPDLLLLVANQMSLTIGFGSPNPNLTWWHVLSFSIQLLVGGWLLFRPRSIVNLARLGRVSDPAHN